MSLLSSLAPKAGSKHSPKRIGRGIGSGMGGTSTKGHKGQLARTGGTVRRGFEGGQTPLHRRLPKFGFSNVAFATPWEIVNLETLNQFDGEVTLETLVAAGLVKGPNVKLLGKGTLTKALKIKLGAASEGAQAAVKKAGGTFEVVK